MDKNNDIQVNKVNKWDKDIAEESLWQVKKSVDTFLCGYSSMLSIEALDTVRTIYVYLDEALDHFNELEARHQKDTGMISEYEEENRDLKSELDIKKDECDDLISRVIRQDIEYAKLETENDDKDDALKKMIKEVAELEKEKIDLEVRLTQEKRKDIHEILRKHNTISDLKAEIRGLESELKQVIGLAKSYGIIIHDERKDAKPDNAINIGMCGYYYVLDEQIKNKITTWEEIERELFTPEEIAESKLRVEHIGRYPWGCLGKYDKLSLQVSSLKKENNNLKQTLLDILEKLEKKVGLCRIHLLDSYEDRANLIMVEHDKLLIKYEKLKDENNNLTTDAKRLSDAVNVWFDMFNDMRHKRDELKKECEKLKETNKSLSCPVACECENFKPKVHHSCDPLDDLPDVEHS